MNSVTFDLSILGPAMLAGLLVLMTHVPLGQQVLQKGIIFIDLAIAQIAGLGVIVAVSFDWGSSGIFVQIAAVTAALSATVLLQWTERHWPDIQEAIIGVLFILAASASILVLAENPHGGEHLKDLLVGQILWVTPSMLGPVAVVYAIVMILWFNLARLGSFGFYGIFAIAITASVQLVGVYLVFASLIIPALATLRLTGMVRLAAGYGIGALGYLTGLVFSTVWDFPPGAVIVWALLVWGVLSSAAIASWYRPT